MVPTASTVADWRALAVEARDLLMPEMILVAFGCLAIVASLQLARDEHRWIGRIALVGLGLSAASLSVQWITLGPGMPWYGFDASVVVDGFGSIVRAIVLAGCAGAVLMATRGKETPRGECFALLLFSAAGMMVLSSSVDLLVLFLALELTAISTAVLVGLWRPGRAATEAMTKYLLLGGLASALLLYGLSVVYAVVGSTRVLDVARAVSSLAESAGPSGDARFLLLAASAFVLVGLLFRVAAVPFHLWAQDVFEGASSSVAALLATAMKVAVLAVLARLLVLGLGGVRDVPGAGGATFPGWEIAVGLVGIASVAVGTVTALTQSNVWRVVACISVTQSGYALLGLVPGNEVGYIGFTISFAVSAALMLGLLTVLAVVDRPDSGGSLERTFAGLAGRAPVLAVAMVVLLVGLMGVPPGAGFVGRLFVVLGLVEAGDAWSSTLALLAVLSTVVSAYTYLRIMRSIFSAAEERAQPRPTASVGLWATLGLAVAVTLAVGVYPQPAIGVSQRAVTVFEPERRETPRVRPEPRRRPRGLPDLFFGDPEPRDGAK